MRKKRILTLALGTVLTLSILMAGCSGNETSPGNSDGSKTENGSGEQVNKLGQLKSFEADTLDGQSFTQEDIAKKDVTVINFWSVYCGPCIDEMPDIAKLTKTLPDNVQIITVCLDGKEEVEFAKQTLKETGFEGTTLIGGSGDLKKVSDEIQYTPTTIVVDKDGNIVGESIIGGQEDLEKVFTDAVNQVLQSMGKAEISDAQK